MADLQVETEHADFSLRANKCYGMTPQIDTSIRNDVYSTIRDDKHFINVSAGPNECYANPAAEALLKSDEVSTTVSAEPLATEIPVMTNECYASKTADRPMEVNSSHNAVPVSTSTTNAQATPTESCPTSSAIPMSTNESYGAVLTTSMALEDCEGYIDVRKV